MFVCVLTTSIFIISLSIISSFAHDTGVDPLGGGIILGGTVHQHITKEAGRVWHDLPFEIHMHLSREVDSALDMACHVNYDTGYDDIVTGSADEDQEWYPYALYIGCSPLPGSRYTNGYVEHFWDPDEPNIGGTAGYDKGFSDPNFYNGQQFASAYRKAQYIWDNKIIPLYRAGNNDSRDEAYYWLGRVAHLLEDIAVPTHVHVVAHDPLLATVFGAGKDEFEKYVASESRYKNYQGSAYQGMEYRFEDLPGIALQENFKWTDLHTNPTNLFKLFWFTAQKTQYYATTGTAQARMGDVGAYRKIDGGEAQFRPSLWTIEGIEPVAIPDEVPVRFHEMADVLVPHALRAVAGLYRLFWLETHLDEQAQQDMPNRAKCESRFGAVIPGTFGKQLDWEPYPDWELRWMDFNFTGGRIIRIWHATYNSTLAIQASTLCRPGKSGQALS